MLTTEIGNNPDHFAARIAAEVRAEMARKMKRRNELATLLGVSLPTASRLLNGQNPFTVKQLATVSNWLGVSTSHFAVLGTGEQS